MKIILTTLLIVVSLCSFAQHKRDTIYFNEDWDVTKSIDSAMYYRIIKESNNLYYVTDYYIQSDSIYMTGAYKDYAQAIEEGEFVCYNEKGLVKLKINYSNGKLDGLYSRFYPTGELHYTESYVDDYNHGDFIVYYPDGNFRRKETYLYGKRKFKACYLPNGKKTKYFPFSIRANPKGGIESVRKYIAKNLRYPDLALQDKIEGKVHIRFVISKTGEITDVRIKQSSGYLILDEEAIRIVKLLPDWSPAQFDGETVESIFNIPITFKLN